MNCKIELTDLDIWEGLRCGAISKKYAIELLLEINLDEEQAKMYAESAIELQSFEEHQRQIVELRTKLADWSIAINE